MRWDILVGVFGVLLMIVVGILAIINEQKEPSDLLVNINPLITIGIVAVFAAVVALFIPQEKVIK